MMPGTSRSAASIIGGMQQVNAVMLRLNSLLAVPTMMAVTCYSVLENLRNISTEEGYELILKSNENIQLLIGNVVAFIVAIIAIKFFIEIIKNTVSNHGAGIA
jgi:undecaprenyl-diphosphatase